MNVTSTLLSRFRTQLNDPGSSVSKIYGFEGVFLYSQYRMSYEDLIIPELKASIKIKSPKKVNDVFKNTLNQHITCCIIKHILQEKLAHRLRIKG